MKKNKQFSPNLTMYKWEYKTDLHGDRYRYDFIGKHKTAGQETTTNVSISGEVSFKIKIDSVEFVIKRTIGGSRSIKRTDKDQELGGDIIYYCDQANPPGTKYTSGLLEFNVIEIVNCD